MLTLQVLLNGILLGGLYACMALGFSLIWGVMNLINLSHGSMIMLGAYLTYVMTSATGIDPLLTLPVTWVSLFAFGYVLQKAIINLVLQASVFMTLIFTFGLDMVMVNLTLALFTADVRSISVPYGNLALGETGLSVPVARVAVFAVALALTLFLHLFLKRTRIGNAIQATSFDREAAALSGIGVSGIYALTFGIGAGMAGAAGTLVAVVSSFSATGGDTLSMKSFVVVVLGGLGSIPGAIFGGLVLGVVENLASLLLDPGYRDAVGFGLLLLILVLRPRGIAGKAFFAEVKA